MISWWISATVSSVCSSNCTLPSFLLTSTSYFLDPYQSYFTPLLSTLVALNVTDAVSLETGAGNKYNTNRPKGKLNSMQVRFLVGDHG